MDFQLEQEENLLRNYSGPDLYLVGPGKIPGSGSSNNKFKRKQIFVYYSADVKECFFLSVIYRLGCQRAVMYGCLLSVYLASNQNIYPRNPIISIQISSKGFCQWLIKINV